MKDRSHLRTSLKEGNVKEGVAFLQRQWSHERGERILAEIGNKDQVYEYRSLRRNKEIRIKKRGWRDILLTTGIGFGEVNGLEAWVVMVDGGINEVGEAENLRFIVGVYKDGTRIAPPITFEDEMEEFKEGPKRKFRLKRSCLDDLEQLVANLSIEEETTKRVTVGRKKGFPVKDRVVVVPPKKRGRPRKDASVATS